MDYAVARLCEAYIDDLHNAPATGDPATASTTAAPTLTPAFRRLLADQVWNMAIRLSRDCEAFAKHAKRSTINVDDVLLFVRNTASVRERLAVGVERVKREKEKGKEKAGRKGKAKLEDKVEE